MSSENIFNKIKSNAFSPLFLVINRNENRKYANQTPLNAKKRVNEKVQPGRSIQSTAKGQRSMLAISSGLGFAHANLAGWRATLLQ